MTYKLVKYEELKGGYIKIKKEELDKILSEEYERGYSAGSMNGGSYRYYWDTKDSPNTYDWGTKNVPYPYITTTETIIC